jgi:hypothetical protein
MLFLSLEFFQIFGYICAIEAVVLVILTRCPLKYRRVIRDDGSDLCLQGRELSPITSKNPSSEIPNHRNYNKIPTSDVGNQKSYVPGKFTFHQIFGIV